jgi:hypothetical protein
LRSGHSLAIDPLRAVAELHEAIAWPHMALVVFFCSSRFDLAVLAKEINTRFAGTPVVGCTTAGEIGPAGYRSGTLVGVSFPSRDFSAATACIEELTTFDEARARDAVASLRHSIDGRAERTFAFLLTDGLCGREEWITYLLQRALGDIALVGGSAGDDELPPGPGRTDRSDDFPALHGLSVQPLCRRQRTHGGDRRRSRRPPCARNQRPSCCR